MFVNSVTNHGNQEKEWNKIGRKEKWGKIMMNDKNGYEFSVLEIRVQLIILTFPLLLPTCPIIPGLGGKSWVKIGQSVLDRRLKCAEFPG